MNKKPFKQEIIYGILFFLAAIITSTITSLWAWSFLLWALFYILWKWVELYYFYCWFSSGADKKKSPLSTGIWEILTNQVIKNNKHNKRVLKKNKILLQQFESTAQALPYATILLNNNFEIQWTNQETQKLFGIIQKDRHNKIDNIIRDPDFIKVLHSNNEVSDIKIKSPKGKNSKTQIRIVKLSNKSHLLVARDISEQESLRQSRKSFVANASHELRTPLTVITGYLEMLANNNEIDSHWQTAIKKAQTQAQRMEKIIADMLKLSGMEHEQYLEREDKDVQMPQLLNKILNEIKNTNRSKDYQFKANISSELSIHGDQSEIISLVQNLINNAIIHNQAGTTIHVKWFEKNNTAQLKICDNGNGIAEKHLTHLTERFYRVDNSRDKNTNSTGLGLAIVKQICLNHQAQLSIESKVKTGTCFTISFPISRFI